MTKHDFAFVGCRLVALYFATYAAFFVAQTVSTVSFLYTAKGDPFDYEFERYVFGFLHLALYVAIALVLWFSARRLARLICGSDSGVGEGEKEQVALESLQTVAFAAVGLYLAVDSAPVIAKVLGYSYQFSLNSEGSEASITYPDLLPDFIRLVLGLTLLFGARLLSGFVGRVGDWGKRLRAWGGESI